MYYIPKILNVYIYAIMVNILYAYYQYPQQSIDCVLYSLYLKFKVVK